MQITRNILLDRGIWRIIQIDVSNPSKALGDIEVEQENILVLPVAGVFAKHEGPRERVVGTPNDAVLIGSARPYRLSFPGGIGDRCLTIRFDDEALAELQPGSRQPLKPLAAPILLPANLLLIRNILWRRFQTGQCDDLEFDECGGMLVEATLRMAEDQVMRRSDSYTRPRAVEAVREAVAVNPGHKWTLAELGKIANTSPYHLSRRFREATGATIYAYVLRARLALALDHLIGTGLDLTNIGLEAGFSSHSHFTARFRSFFGMTPTAFRLTANTVRVAEMRRIVTAGAFCN
jgi:AraC family transcriptional regulator